MYNEKCDLDLFVCLEDLLSQYTDNSNIFVIGDFNSWSGVNDDFINNDRLRDTFTNRLSSVSHYVPDSVINKRVTMDLTPNQFGRQLVSLCKTRGLRILNGRHRDDRHGNITEEILTAIKKLNMNKSCGNDKILNEYFIKGKDILMPCRYSTCFETRGQK